MKVPRTYISKVEMSRTVPTIATLYGMASALEIEVHHLLRDARLDRLEKEAISQDPFLPSVAARLLNSLLAENFADLRVYRLTDPESERFDQVASGLSGFSHLGSQAGEIGR